MRKDFTQPFIKLNNPTVYLLIEVGNDSFLQLLETDELGAFYAETLYLELDDSKDIVLQLVELLHKSGLELLSYRELLRETSVSYSYLDSTPGTSNSTICLHVIAERTNRSATDKPDKAVNFLPLVKFLYNLYESTSSNRLLEAGVAQLLNERDWREHIYHLFGSEATEEY